MIRTGLYYVTEGDNWVIGREGLAILAGMRGLIPEIPWAITSTAEGLRAQLVHFGSLWSFAGNIERTHQSNRMIATVYHGRKDMAGMGEAWDSLRSHLSLLDKVITACTMMLERLRIFGVPEAKLHLVPLGVDLGLFRPPTLQEHMDQRRCLGIPDDAICIGSFQKDGVGWGEGLEPKLIKGPDIFLDVVTRLSERYKIFVLLNGPARGYIKRGLELANIEYRHDNTPFTELPLYYHCLDLYLVTSREEGGPKALHESMATGVPLISTRVGMAPDMIQTGVNGILTDVEDTDKLVEEARTLIDDSDLRRRLVENALRTIQQYDYSIIARKYHQDIYVPLLPK
jgi:glycosyltransferase involved in cell wall biosynthesis